MIILLVLYFVFFLFWVLGTILAIYNSVKNYDPHSKMKLALNVYIWTCVGILVLTFFYMYSVDWTAPLNFGG